MARVFKIGKNWYTDFQYQGKRYREAVGPDKQIAQAVLGEKIKAMKQGRSLDLQKKCTTTLREFEPRFMEWSKAHKRSWERDQRSLAYLLEFFGDKILSQITMTDVERYKSARVNGVIQREGRTAGGATVNRELACLRKALNLAVDLGVISDNPVKGKIKMFKEGDGRKSFLEPEQIKKLLAACSNRLRPIVHLALLTGMRRQEVLGLRWSEVSVPRGTINLPGSRTKNGRPRTVPLVDEAKQIVKQAERARPDGCPTVFHQNGRPIKSVRGGFEGACSRAGIRDFHFHDLRHCFASALAMRGVSLKVIADLLGHRTLSMVQRYAHLAPEALMNAALEAARYMEGTEPTGVTRMPAESDQGDKETDKSRSGSNLVSLESRQVRG